MTETTSDSANFKARYLLRGIMTRCEPFVKFDNVSKSYGNFTVLTDISLELGRGDVFGYIGPNGAGKTTTIKSLVGLITDFSGRLTINGMDMPDQKDRIHRLMGYLPQKVSFQEWRTVEHTLATMGRLSGVDVAEIESRIEHVLGVVGMSDSRHRKVKELSGGNVQKVGLAQAMLHSPQLLVLDEPLSGLDPASRYQVKEIIKELNKGETTVFFSSHILSDVQDVATKIGILGWGRILALGNLHELEEEFGTPRVLNIEFSEDNSDPDVIAAMEGVTDVTTTVPTGLRVRISDERDMDEVSDRIVRTLLNQGCRIRKFTPSTPSLDELYMRYVNRGGQA